MRKPRVFEFGLIVTLLASCSTQRQEDPGHDAAVVDTAADATAARPIWSVESRGIAVGCVGFWQGSMSFNASRDQLSGEQLGLLEQMTRVSAGGPCIADGMGCSITVTAPDGSIADYSAEQFDAVCGGGPVPANRIGYTSFAPFLETIHCLYAKGAAFGQDPTPIPPDVRCSNGLFTSGPAALDRVLSVDDPGVLHHIDLAGCGYAGREAEKLHLLLFADGATSPLAQGAIVSTIGPDGACVRLDYTFAAAGKYRMNVVVDSDFGPGDFYFKFY